MWNHIRLYLSAALVLLVCTIAAHTQELRVGPVAQLGLDVPYAGFPTYSNVQNCCGDFGIGIGATGLAGIEADVNLSKDLAIGFRALAGGGTSVMWNNDQIGWWMKRTPTGNKVYPAYSTYALELSGFVVDGSLFMTMPIGGYSPWRLIVGAGGTKYPTMTYDQFEVFDENKESILEDSRRPQRDTSQGDITQGLETSIRAIMGLRREMSISDQTMLIYDLTADIGLTPLLRTASGSLVPYSIRGSIGLLFSIASYDDVPMSEEPEIVVVDTIAFDTAHVLPAAEQVLQPEQVVVNDATSTDTSITVIAEVPEQPHQPELQTDIQPESKQKVSQPIVRKIVFQLLPMIFFAPGSASINTALYRHIDKPASDHYTVNTQLLDIIGKRMAETYPDAVLRVSGHSNGRSSDSAVKNIGFARAEAVSAYLQQKWNISSSRIVISGTDNVSPTACTYKLRSAQDMADAEEENSRCELTSPSRPELLAPVIVEDTLSTLDALQSYSTTLRLLYVNAKMYQQEDVLFSTLSQPGTLESIEIVGYTDRKGPETVNRRLAELRARSAAVAMIGKKKVPVTIDWKGEGAGSMPAPYTNETVIGRLLNRCADIRFHWINRAP